MVMTKDEELAKLIQDYRNRDPRRTGKTIRKRKAGIEERHRLRKSAHEAWMGEIKRDPARSIIHPFFPHPYVRRRA